VLPFDFVEQKSSHGGKRAGAGRKPTGTIGLHLRVPPETLLQIADLIDGRRGWTRGIIVNHAVAEKHARWQKAKKKARRETHERLERSDDPKIKEWIAEVRTKLAAHGSMCRKAPILGQYALEAVQARPADMQDRLDWLVVEAESHWFNIAFTIDDDGVAYRATEMTYNQVRSAGIIRTYREAPKEPK
jgi:hypothetical protein